MEISMRALVTSIHGMGFGALFILLFPVALVELYRLSSSRWTSPPSPAELRVARVCLLAMIVLGWCAVFMGAYVIYPWYRAVPPIGTADLAHYPQQLLMSSRRTIGWHELGMEWKEHLAWFAPIAMTMVGYVFMKYGSSLYRQRQIRAAVLAFTIVAFVAAGITGLFGAFLNKNAPVRGGALITLMGGKSP